MTASRRSPRNRRSIRLPKFDYGQDGAYFITICTHRRASLFGTIQQGRMILTAEGHVAWDEWLRSPTIRPELALGAFVVMPDHVHGIVIINSANIVGAHGDAPIPRDPSHRGVGGHGRASVPPDPSHRGVGGHGRASVPPDPSHRDVGAHGRAPLRPYRSDREPGMPAPARRTIGTFVRGYKCAVTVAINIARRSPGISVWQRNYYERVIRTERAFRAITHYIQDNPRRAWKFS